MKRAVVDQALIGLLVIGSIFAFVATVNDERLARNKVFELTQLATITSKAMATHYMENTNICEAEAIANSLLGQTETGSEVLVNNNINYTWRDANSDGNPDSVTSTINNYQQSNFWYRLLGLDGFTINNINHTSDVNVANASYNVTMRYGGSNAGYFNMIGTYEVDDDGCIHSPKIWLDDKRLYEVGDELGSIQMPQSRMFIVANGFSKYGNKTATVNSDITIEGCNPPNAQFPQQYPNVTIDGLTNKAPTYFQDTTYNSDNGYEHMQIIPKSEHDLYVDYVEGRVDGNTHTYEEWVAYAQANDINYQTDENHEYIFAMEDLPNGGDKDFNDILLDTTMTLSPETINTETVANNGVITASCQDVVEEPILNLNTSEHCNGIGNGCKKCINKGERCDEWNDFVDNRCNGDSSCQDCMYSKEGCTQSIYDGFFNN